jgi:hypothetical protein
LAGIWERRGVEFAQEICFRFPILIAERSEKMKPIVRAGLVLALGILFVALAAFAHADATVRSGLLAVGCIFLGMGINPFLTS